MTASQTSKSRTAKALGMNAPAPAGDDAPAWDTPDAGQVDPALRGPAGDAGDDAQAGNAAGDMPPELASFVDWLAEKATGNDDDTVQSLIDAIREMATASSPAEVLAGGTPTHAREVLDRPMLITAIKIREGDFEESGNLGYYAAMDVVFIDTEQVRIVTCGGSKVLAKLWQLDIMNAWPQAVYIREKTLKNGHGVLNLYPVEEPV